MITITKQSREFNEVEKYLMTVAPSIKSMKDVADNTSIAIDGFIEFDDEKEDTGEVNHIVSVITPDSEVYSFQSATFKRSLNDIITIMGDKPFSIVKISGKTKAGRDYINCILDVKSLGTKATKKK